ncbi:MAG: bifunctional demethylmenaquinone methyltransferase/2-methoxy-6-polyprenyl-1,4-benzoquinol methylase, partial [Mycobacterium sp.]|nr:bifunctional demethylmenaquinone methyltransferase/2-methoxy-6-polyprenyl-1,4-benzoquinol methylase [Mycobacterium sp.]
MFDAVARRYDITNTVLSGGQDRAWRRATREALDLRPGEAVLDLAAGTSVSTLE